MKSRATKTGIDHNFSCQRMQSFAFTDIIYCTRKWGAIYLAVSSFEIWRISLHILFSPFLSFRHFLSNFFLFRFGFFFLFWTHLQRAHIDRKWIFSFFRKKKLQTFWRTKYIPFRKKDGNEMESLDGWRCNIVIFAARLGGKIDSQDWAERNMTSMQAIHCDITLHSGSSSSNSTNKVISIKRIEPWNLLFTISLEHSPALPIFSHTFTPNFQ